MSAACPKGSSEMGEVKSVSDKVDWVTKRSLCSLPNIFRELGIQVEEDIKIRNALRPANSPYEFSVLENGDGITVLLKTKDVQKSVTFSLAEHAFVVRDDQGNMLFEVTLTFSDEGECKMKVNDVERELWQVRRMALEGL